MYLIERNKQFIGLELGYLDSGLVIMKQIIGRLSVLALLSLSANSALATFLQGKVYCESNRDGQIEHEFNKGLFGMEVSVLCMETSDSSEFRQVVCLSPNEPFK